jgi:hypothetical protein
MRADRNSDGTADGAAHADQGDGRQPRTNRQPAETLTREEYDAPMCRQGIRMAFSGLISGFWKRIVMGTVLLGCGQDREGPLR